MEKETFVYAGMLDVEDGDFTLDVGQLIVNADGITFRLSGYDVNGAYSIEGVATKAALGYFSSSQLDLLYKNYNGVSLATIQFDVITLSPQKAKCFVKGQWRQYGDTWNFSGNLGRYKPEK